MKRGRQRGIAAVELALLLTGSLLIVPCMLLFGRVFWEYTVLQKAVHDGTRYLASIPASDMTNASAYFAARAAARHIVLDAIVAGGLAALPDPELIQVACVPNCGSAALPDTIRLTVDLSVSDAQYGDSFTGAFLPPDGFVISANVTMRYGN